MLLHGVSCRGRRGMAAAAASDAAAAADMRKAAPRGAGPARQAGRGRQARPAGQLRPSWARAARPPGPETGCRPRPLADQPPPPRAARRGPHPGRGESSRLRWHRRFTAIEPRVTIPSPRGAPAAAKPRLARGRGPGRAGGRPPRRALTSGRCSRLPDRTRAPHCGSSRPAGGGRGRRGAGGESPRLFILQKLGSITPN